MTGYLPVPNVKVSSAPGMNEEQHSVSVPWSKFSPDSAPLLPLTSGAIQVSISIRDRH